jgi:hypothetical protein
MHRWPLVLLGLAACGPSDGIDFPDTLGPLEANRAPRIEGEGYPEVIVFAAGKDDGTYWAHGRAYVHGTVDDVFAALQRPAVLVDRREVDAYDVTWDTEPAYEVSLTLQQTVEDVLTIEYDTTWVMERQDVDVSGTTRAAAQWDKTDGTQFIDLLAGSLVVTSPTPGVSELELVAWMEATLRDEETLKSYQRDLHADIVAAVAGSPLPSY